MIRPGPLLLAAVVSLGALAPVASADAPDDIVISAERSGWAEFTLARVTQPSGGQPLKIVGGGTYAVVLIEGIDVEQPSYAPARFFFGAVRISGVSAKPVTVGAPFQMHPGRYRATVVSDAPVRAVLDLDETSAGVAVRATRPVTDAARTAKGSVAQGRGATEARIGNAVPAGFHALALAHVQGVRVADTRLCAAGPTRSCPARPLLPFAPPSPLPTPPEVPIPGPGSDAVSPLVIQPSRSVQDVLASVDGIHIGTTTVAVGSVAFRRR